MLFFIGHRAEMRAHRLCAFAILLIDSDVQHSVQLSFHTDY
ncbi:MAG: hypothetical protein ACI4XW_02850 [Candidatus Spyradocola sp.]